MIRRSSAGVTLAGVLAAAVAAPLAAEPLDEPACTALASELALLEGGGAGENIAKGPEWAKTNLKPEQIAYIRRLIKVREDLNFRCRTFAVVRESPGPDSAPANAPEPGRKPEDGPGVASTAAEPPPPVRPERAAARAATPKPKAAPGDPAAPQRKPAEPKPDKLKRPRTAEKPARSNDAYVPPAGTESTFQVPTGVSPQPSAPAR